MRAFIVRSLRRMISAESKKGAINDATLSRCECIQTYIYTKLRIAAAADTTSYDAKHIGKLIFPLCAVLYSNRNYIYFCCATHSVAAGSGWRFFCV